MSHRRRAALCWAMLVALSTTGALAQERPASQQEYWAQFDKRNWSAAVAAAEQLAAAARANTQSGPLALAEALVLLGNAQLGSGDFVSAEATFAEALALAEQSGSQSALLDPLRGMGYALAGAGKHEQAIPPLERALILSRRNRGLFDVSQQNILRQLGSSLTKVGQLEEASRHMSYMLRVGEQAYGKSDPRMAQLMCQVAEWYAEVGAFEPARGLYRAAASIVEKKLGRNDLALLEPLRGLARTYTQELFYTTRGIPTDRERAPSDADGASNERQALNPRYLAADGEKALERALKIIESQPDPPNDEYIATLVQLGDWRQIRHQPDRALPLYRRAAQLRTSNTAPANEAAKKEETAVALLTFPVRVYYPTPWLATRNLTLPPDQVDETFVEIEFTVTKTGEVANPRVTDENGTARQVAESLDAIRGARFRPKFVDGEPVDTPGMTNREVFRMRKQTQQDGAS